MLTQCCEVETWQFSCLRKDSQPVAEQLSMVIVLEHLVLAWWSASACAVPMSNSLHWGLNPGPSVYRTDALPLSYKGLA